MQTESLRTSNSDRRKHGHQLLFLAAILFLALVVNRGTIDAYALSPFLGSLTGQEIQTTLLRSIPGGWVGRDIAVTPDGQRLYASSSQTTVSAIDTNTFEQLANIIICGNSAGTAITPDGAYVYVASYCGGGKVTVIRVSDNTVVKTLSGVVNVPWGVAASPDGQFVYVTDDANGSNTVAVIRTSDHSVVGRIGGVGNRSRGIAITPDGRYVYVTSFGSNTISVVDTSVNQVIETIPVSGGFLEGVTVTPDSEYAYVANGTQLVVIRTSDHSVDATIPLPSNIHDISFTPDGKYAYIGAGLLYIMRTSDRTIVETLDTTGAGNWNDFAALAVSPTTNHVYVTNSIDHSISIFTYVSELVDLSISDVLPIQVVESPDINSDGKIDLVQGKPMVVRVKISVENATALPEKQMITTKLIFQSTEFALSQTIKELVDNEFYVNFSSLDFPTLNPTTLGDSTILVQVAVDGISESNENNNQATPLVITVKDTKGLYVAYLRVDCLGALDTYADTVSQAGEYLSAVYPINPDPSEFTNEAIESSITCRGTLAEDASALWKEGKMLTSGKAQYIVGIVDPNWAESRMPDGDGVALGITWCGANQAFVLDGRWETVAHEIGHGFGLSHPKAERKCEAEPNDSSTQGYWVDKSRAIQGVPSLMGPGSMRPPLFPSNSLWITHDDYEHLFTKNLEDVTDPEVLLVSFILHKNGRVDWEPLYRLPTGILDSAEPGDYSLQVLDSAGGILYNLPFKAHFFVLTHPPSPTDTIPIGFAVPYPPEATTVQVQHNGQIIAQESVSTKLLRDAVMSIPDAGFVKNPNQRRNALLNKIDEFDAMLTAGDLTGAQDKLENDIRKHLVAWLVDDYPTQTPLEYTKPAILELVDELLQRLVS